MSSSGFTGRATECIAKGMARITRFVLQSRSGVTAMLSSMKTSTLPRSFTGISTDKSLAVANDMSGGKETGSGILSAVSSKNESKFQDEH